MKIILFMDSPVIPTGYASTCRLTARELMKRGHEVYATAFNGGPQKEEVFEWGGIQVIPNDALKRNPNGIYGDAEFVTKVFRDFKPDILFFHNDSYRYSYIEHLPQEILDKSVFWLPFEGEIQDMQGVRLFSKCAATRFVTNHALNMHKDHLKGKDIGYIPHAINMDNLGVAENKRALKSEKRLGIEDKFVVSRVDRHQPRKYWDRTIRAFGKFAEGKDDVFLIAKCNPRDITMWNEEKKEGMDLEALVEELGLQDKVKFDDFFFDDSYMARAFYQPADVFLTTTSGEGFGLTPAEAMACGIPVIYPDTPVLPEVVGNGGIKYKIDGKFFYDPMQVWHNLPSIEAAAEKLEWAYHDWKHNDGIELAKISKMAREKALSKYDPQVVYDQWDEVFRSVSERGSMVSVVTVLYNLQGDEQIYGEDGIDQFHKTMMEHVKHPYEWIIIDNGSPARDVTREWLKKAASENRRIRPVLLDKNLGFAGANNKGIAMAKGQGVVLCNPDSEALDPRKQGQPCDFLAMLAQTAKKDPEIGIIGMELNARDDILPGSKFPYFCCAFLTRKCLDAVKLAEEQWFDEKFWPAYYEDADLCLRAQQAGFKVVANKFVPFYHKSGGTNKFAIEGGAEGPYVKPLREALRALSEERPDMADWARKKGELEANGMQGLISGNIAYLNDKWGLAARKKIKVVWETRIGDGVGFSQIVEGLAPEMERMGFDVYINDWANGRNIEDPEVRKLVEKYARANVGGDLDDAIHIVCWLMETFLNCDANYKIGVSLCESTKVRESYLQACNSMDRILTFSKFCKNVQINSGYKVPIDIIAPGVHPIYMNFHRRPSPALEDPIKFKFLNVGVSQGRKDTHRLVESFCQAFPKDGDKFPEVESNFPLKPGQVELILKSNNFGELQWVEPYKQRALIRTIFTGEDARAEGKDFTMQEMYDLYCEADAYVHPSHGEGIGMPILEAAATGLPTIFTDWSSPHEYLNEANSYPCSLSPYPGTTFTQAYPGAPGDNGQWANIHIGHMKHLMYEVIRDREAAQEKGYKASEHIKENFNWVNTARDMIPIVFRWEKERAAKTTKEHFDPLTFVKPEMEPVKTGDRVMIDIVTRDRHSYLCSLVTSLMGQTFKNWDIIIECDDADESMPNDYQIMSLMYRLRHEGHGWRIIRSHRQGPHMAHDRTLQMTSEDPTYKYKLICRIDDDIIVKPDFLEKLYEQFLKDEKCELAAVGGVYLDPKRSDQEQMAPADFRESIEYAGKIDHNVPWPYICRYPEDTAPREVEHLYSSFMYRVEVANAVGGYCRKFSQIGHREESDFSYRFWLGGYKLLVHPEAVGYHFSAPSGGIRSGGIGDDQTKQALASMDHQIYEKRLRKWKQRYEMRKKGRAKPEIPEPEIIVEKIRKDEAPKKDRKGLAIVINGGKNLNRIRKAIRRFSKYSEDIYLTCENEEAKTIDDVKMVATSPDESAMLAQALASETSEGPEFVMTVSDTMRFKGDPMSLLSDDYDDYVFECYKTYIPGRTMKDLKGSPVFVQDESVGDLIGPEVRNECLLYRVRPNRDKADLGRTYYASNVIVLDDQRIPPVEGKSARGNELVPVSEMESRAWTKICFYQFPAGDLKEPFVAEVKPDKDLVSIIIPTYGRIQDLKRCIASINSHTTTPFELIVVDNGSSDGTAAYLDEMMKKMSNLRVLRQQVNLGYQKAINLGASAARGEYLLFFNDDAWIEKRMPDGRDWIRVLVDELNANPVLGMVGPHGDKSPALGIDMLFFWCVMIRKDVFRQVGPLDDLTFINYGGDDDYCMRLKKAKYDVKVKPVFEGVLRHLMNREPPDKKNKELEESRIKLREKWEKKTVSV